MYSCCDKACKIKIKIYCFSRVERVKYILQHLNNLPKKDEVIFPARQARNKFAISSRAVKILWPNLFSSVAFVGVN
jgi:hypothetical protein